MADGLQGVGGQEAAQGDREGIPPDQRKQQGGADADLEGAEVVQGVLVAGKGDEAGERAGRYSCPEPATSMPAPGYAEDGGDVGAA